MIGTVERRIVELADPARNLIAVISDTHGRPHPALLPTLERLMPALILHAGDVGDPSLIETLGALSPTFVVGGNIDSPVWRWPKSMILQIRRGEDIRLDVLLLHIALARLRLNPEARSFLKESPVHLVVFGHSHLPFLGREGSVLLFNPGSAGPQRFGLPTTMGLIDLSGDRLVFKHLDLATGREWKPGLEKG